MCKISVNKTFEDFCFANSQVSFCTLNNISHSTQLKYIYIYNKKVPFSEKAILILPEDISESLVLASCIKIRNSQSHHYIIIIMLKNCSQASFF